MQASEVPSEQPTAGPASFRSVGGSESSRFWVQGCGFRGSGVLGFCEGFFFGFLGLGFRVWGMGDIKKDIPKK